MKNSHLSAERVNRPVGVFLPSLRWKNSLLLFLWLFLQGMALSLHAQRPRLVVVIVVDQMRADYLDRFGQGFGPGGFNLLLREGAVFANCQFDYDSTETAPGHAVFSTGSYTRHNGIVGNIWYDVERGKMITALED